MDCSNTLKRLLLAAVLLAGTGFAQTAPLIPLAPGNTWTLVSPYSSSPIVVSVEWAAVVGSQTVASLRFQNPVLTYSLLVSSDSTGVTMDGIALSGIESRFNVAAPLFRLGGTPGQTWTGAGGAVTLVSNSDVVTSKAGTFSGCLRYHLVSTDGSEQWWTIAPGVGPVAFGDPAWAFVLTSLTNYSAPAVLPALSSPCPAVGLSSIPQGSLLTSAQREGALGVAVGMGSQTLNVNARWSELEPSPGVYSLARIQNEMQLAQKYGLMALLTIGGIYAGVNAMPPDLQGRAWDDPLVISRFEALLAHVLPTVPAAVKWLNLGYEVDSYLSVHQNELPNYRRFLDTVKPYAKGLKSVPVGVVFSFDSTFASNLVFVGLHSFADQITFDYYDVGPNFQQRDVATVDKDLWLMTRLAEGRPLVLGEVGYSSGSASGSSLSRQNQFFQNFFTALSKRGNQFQAVTLWSLNDLPPAAVNQALAIHALNSSASAAFMGTLGLRDSAGNPKPAWSSYGTWQATMNKANACSTAQ